MVIKRSLIIGNTARGLNAAKEDANMAAAWGEKFIHFEPTAVVIGPQTDYRDVADLVPRFHGTDVCLVKNSSHGYSTLGADGKRETGLWWGTAVPYDTFFRFIMVPLRACCRYVIFINDACHSGAALHHPAAPADAPATKVKGIELVGGLPPLVEPVQYKVITPTSVLISACGWGPKQYSYMDFAGGTLAEPYWPTNTAGRSLFTACFWTAVAEDADDYTAAGHKLNTVVTATEWRSTNMLRTWGTGPSWLPMKPAYPIPNVTMRKGSQVPPNILNL